jgi:hypothetical protein
VERSKEMRDGRRAAYERSRRQKVEQRRQRRITGTASESKQEGIKKHILEAKE